MVKEISIRTVWERFSEDQRRKLDKEKWSQRLGGLFDMAIKEGHRVFVAEDENQSFLGYVWVGERSNLMTGTRHGYIYDVFVKEEHRRKGVGMILMEKAESYCRETGYTEMLLMVAINNQPAEKLYIKQGFKAEQKYMLKRLT
ncbi:MAG: GNAT family N-acetyltransferase [Candidatus Bathyarchaeota archaeon]|nr:MAG: GNAT family N-acetyltransferase [Candidatus Bathyarchaeota archaeon]